MEPDQNLLKHLRKLRLLKEAPEDVLLKIANNAQPRTLEKNDLLFREGDQSSSLFIIRSGWVKIVTTGDSGQEVTLNQSGPGQVIGEMSLIDQQNRSSSVIALSPTTLLEIDHAVILSVLDEYPKLMQLFLRDMSQRVRFANAYINESIEWCQQIAAGNYDFVQDQVQQSQQTIVATQSHQGRATAFLSAFFKMVEQIRSREDHLKQQIQQLTIEIDEARREKAVEEITGSSFFEELQSKARSLRAKRRGRQESADDSAD